MNKIHQRRFLTCSLEFDPYNIENNPDALNPKQDFAALKAMLVACVRRNLVDSTSSVTLSSLSSSSNSAAAAAAAAPPDTVLPKIELLLADFDDYSESELISQLFKFSREYFQSSAPASPKSSTIPVSRTSSPGLSPHAAPFYPGSPFSFSGTSTPASTSLPPSPYPGRNIVSQDPDDEPDDSPYFSEEK